MSMLYCFEETVQTILVQNPNSLQTIDKLLSSFESEIYSKQTHNKLCANGLQTKGNTDKYASI